MKLGEAIRRVDALVDNPYPDEEKRKWLSTLDGLIWLNVMGPHSESETFEQYGKNDAQRELLVPFPYDEIYIHWLATQIYLANKEIDLYNNAAEMYGRFYHDFAQYWNRTHKAADSLRFKNYRLE